MDLTCTEKSSSSGTYRTTNAIRDRTIFEDERVINNLLNEELFCIPKCNYFEAVQFDIQPFMRKVVTTWMLEVCEEQIVEEQVFPLAVNFMDRVLCTGPIRRQHLQLLGSTCLLIASKIRSTNLLPIDLLCAYTDYSVTYDHLASWEVLVLSKLEWKISGVTGFDYIDQVIERCSWGNESPLLRRHALTLVSISYTEPDLIQTPPSVIAAACIISAVRGLKLSCRTIAPKDVCTMLRINVDSIEHVVEIIDKAVQKVALSSPVKNSQSSTSKGYESPPYGQPETPTEVESICF